MDLMAVECFNCGKRRHFARNCKSPPQKGKRVNFAGQRKQTLYQTEEETGPDDNHSEYGILNPSSSESSSSNLDADETFTLMSTYELNHDETSVTSNNGVMSRKLPVYSAVLDEEENAKTIIDSCSSTLYIREQLGEEMGKKITRIEPRNVKIADKEIVTINGICTFKMKLGNLPVETVTAYTFHLGSVDLVLGLPWLIKHNPRVDWPTLSYEFIRNGRRYFLWPAKPTPSIRITSPEDFRSFVDKSTSLYLIDRHKVSPPQAPPDSMPDKKDTKQPTKLPRKILRWIKRKCPDLLREIGRPANLEPFHIDTGDAKPINIRPRSHSPLDLEKIKEFIEENLKNGVISESESPWSTPLVLAKKPDGSI